MPRFWLISLLVVILKKDKDAADPTSYRLIDLECFRNGTSEQISTFSFLYA
ncbi:hypothetical protein B0H19DRAFT_1264936 [Mycena capillaripes]|nr:hypothetical protein B0H19DRAFT_1277865 [Mycena capillaripes]KAJ6550072.1 hypothetical protein B0H19DRAFT_1264936 [Mycena capillaripes]